MTEIRSDSVSVANSAIGKTTSMKGKPVQSLADKKLEAQEHAAQMEKLLSSRNPAYVLNYLVKKTNFDKDQIRALQRIYRCFKGSSLMDRLRYREMVCTLLGITDTMMLDRIFQAFDGDNEGSVSENEWIIGLSVQMKGTLDQQIAYTYDVYDVNGDRSIGRDEISAFYRNAFYPIPGVLEPEEVDDATNELVEIAMRKFDLNRDGNITFAEYYHVIRNDPLLLEPFGECLPKEKAALTFTGLLDVNERNFNSYYSRPGDSGFTAERHRYTKHQGENYHHTEFKGDLDLDVLPATPLSMQSMGLLLPTCTPQKSKKPAEPKKKKAQDSHKKPDSGVSSRKK